jgi:hypothetical protein
MVENVILSIAAVSVVWSGQGFCRELRSWSSYHRQARRPSNACFRSKLRHKIHLTGSQNVIVPVLKIDLLIFMQLKPPWALALDLSLQPLVEAVPPLKGSRELLSSSYLTNLQCLPVSLQKSATTSKGAIRIHGIARNLVEQGRIDQRFLLELLWKSLSWLLMHSRRQQ